ncbi:MAG: L,D-transpeptidase family protein, partial [Hyphomicrobium sp.]
IKLSLVAMEYARHARGDRIDTPSEQLSSYLDRKPQLVERPKLIEALAGATDTGAYLRSLHPKHAQFELLREKLLEVRAAQKSGNEPEAIPEGPKITPGKVHWQVAILRRRLNVAMQAAKPDGTPMEEGYYDETLARAVIQYKEKNALEPINATISNDLRKALNQKSRLDERMLLANMEQWRWMPETLGETYVWVNIPEFLVRVKKHEQIIHEERIVTGRYETQTPIFSNRLKTVVFQPSWNVPESIKVNELLPKLRGGDNPIASQGLRIERNGRDIDVWDIDWNRQDIRNYHIFQPPGDANVLGIVKFLFPNQHSVYLHDTPSKRLFNEKVRTFSHGCMRVRNPVQLAEVIMAEDKGWDKAKVNEMITTGPEDNDVALDRAIPVHVTYFTAWVDDAGEVKTFADVYGHEQRIKLGLEGRWSEIVKNRDHLAPADPGLIAATTSREDWGDQDEDRPVRAGRRSRPQRYSFDDEDPRPLARAQPPPGYRQVYPKKKSGSPISDIFNNIFGNN